MIVVDPKVEEPKQETPKKETPWIITVVRSVN